MFSNQLFSGFLDNQNLDYSLYINVIQQVKMEPVPPVTILDNTYPALADGVYDAIILGTGLKECIIAGLLATEGKKVYNLTYSWYVGFGLRS